MLLYKYLHEDRIDILENGLIRFTQPKFFNDPYDTRPTVNSMLDAETYEKFVNLDVLISKNVESITKEKGAEWGKLAQAFFQQNRSLVSSAFKDSFTGKNDIVSNLLNEELNKFVGILSLSRIKNNNLMWGHYANSSKGFILGLDSTHSFFHPDYLKDDPNFGKLIQVEYIKTKKIYDDLKQLKPFNFFLEKSNHWKYEKEVRMLLQLEKADVTIEDKIKLFSIPPTCIKELILGFNMEKSKIERILSIISEERYRHVNILKVVPDDNSFEFKIEQF